MRKSGFPDKNGLNWMASMVINEFGTICVWSDDNFIVVKAVSRVSWYRQGYMIKEKPVWDFFI